MNNKLDYTNLYELATNSPKCKILSCNIVKRGSWMNPHNYYTYLFDFIVVNEILIFLVPDKYSFDYKHNIYSLVYVKLASS